MKRFINLLLFSALIIVNSIGFSAVMVSMNKVQFERVFINKTLTSIPTDNLNGRTINNTFSMYLDNQGNIWGKMSKKPANQPQTDKGVYSITNDGTFYITWQHWDRAKKLCGHVFITQNAYISIDCAGVFHTVFMKASVKSGNHLK